MPVSLLFPGSFHGLRATVNGGESGFCRVRFPHKNGGKAINRHFLAKHFLASLALAPLLLLASPGAGKADDASDKQAFHDFLAAAKNNASADKDKVVAFYKTTGAYWRAHWLDYSHNPENYADVMALYHADQALYPRPFVVPDPQRYEKDIEAFRNFDARNALPKNPALFVGSSTIVKWKTADAFPGFNVINRGFGGNVIEDVLYYYKDVIGKYHPSAVLFYCDNDVTGGDSGDHAFDLTMQVYHKVRADFPKVPFVFLSMKHAPNSAFANPGGSSHRSLQ